MTEKTEIQTMPLPVKLTNEEKLLKGQEQARLRDAIRVVQAEKKTAMDAFAERIKALETDRDRATDAERDGFETRPVEVREDRNYRTGTIRIIRVDTGEVVKTRAMTAEEREEAQVTMFPGGGAKKTASGSGDQRQAVIDAVRAAGKPLSKRAICAVVSGTHAVTRGIVDELVHEGVLTSSADGFGMVDEADDEIAHTH